MTINYNDTARITLQDGNIDLELKFDPIDDLPSVVVSDRLAEILGLSVEPDYQVNTLSYSYQAGYENACYGPYENMSFSGAYHPDVVCEGHGVCRWCGCILTSG